MHVWLHLSLHAKQQRGTGGLLATRHSQARILETELGSCQMLRVYDRARSAFAFLIKSKLGS